MQVVFENENEEGPIGRINSVDFVIFTKRVSRCLERECVGRPRRRNIRI